MPDIPHHVMALFQALKFQGSRPEDLRALRDNDWKDLLSRWEVTRFLVPLSQACDDFLPGWVRTQVDREIRGNAQRFERIKSEYSTLATAVKAANADHLVLKGFSQCPDFVEHPRFRRQSDFDLYCPPDSIARARGAISELGYRIVEWIELGPTDHLPPMSRDPKWKWRGDFFDPEMPIAVELHFRFWDEESAHLGPQNLDEFWFRRVERSLGDFIFPALCPVDHFGYFALNVVRNLLRGAERPHNLYELARFLHNRADDARLWQAWVDLHDDSLRSLEAISCRLAAHTFACRLPSAMEQQIARMPAAVHAWFARYADSPLNSEYRPNKDLVWLHVSLLESPRSKRAVLFRKLIPRKITPARAPYFDDVVVNQDLTASTAVQVSPFRKRARHLAYVVNRAAYHARILPITLWHGVRWWVKAKNISGSFWTFFAACFFCDLGIYIFFFLYNLYLLDRGFKENFLGLVASATSIGSIVGTIPAGILAQRLGLRKSLLLCLTAVPLIFALRSLVMSEAALLLLAFLGGSMFTIWAVCISPAVAQLTSTRTRTLGFSMIFSSGIAVGILGGQAGGHLPGWLAQMGPAVTAVRAKQLALLIACGVMALALWPLSRLRFTVPATREKKLYPRSPFLLRYLPVIAVWSFAVGCFSPFFSVYFSQHLHMPVRQIGTVYSFSHVSQLVAMLAAPLVLRKFGLVTGIMYTQIAAAIALGCLAAVSAGPGAAMIYVTYVAFLWMSEPGMFSLLMNQVSPSEQTGASAMNFLVINVSQAIAAAAAGASFVRFGYPAVLSVTAGIGLIAACLFRMLLGKDPVPVSQASPAEASS
jgi:MFS family permease